MDVRIRYHRFTLNIPDLLHTRTVSGEVYQSRTTQSLSNVLLEFPRSEGRSVSLFFFCIVSKEISRISLPTDRQLRKGSLKTKNKTFRLKTKNKWRLFNPTVDVYCPFVRRFTRHRETVYGSRCRSWVPQTY